MKTARQFLDIRTQNIEDLLIRQGKHPNPDKYELRNDYAPCYGGYKMVFVDKTNHGHLQFGLSNNRMKAKEFESFQEGVLWALMTQENK